MVSATEQRDEIFEKIESCEFCKSGSGVCVGCWQLWHEIKKLQPAFEKEVSERGQLELFSPLDKVS